MKNTYVFAGLAAFIISAILGPIIIPVLQRIKAGQTEREDGPKSHQNKTGTPTMGAFIFLISFVAVSFIFADSVKEILPIMFLTIGFAVVGFIDDFIKVVLKRSEGLTPLQKMALQIVVAVVYSVWCFMSEGTFEVLIPFVNRTVSMGWIGIPILSFIIIGTVNGSNFTDGVDGLEASVTAAICAFFFIVACGAKSSSAVLLVAMFAALMGFLLFNVNKARVFMGDTGSLALGGFVAAIAHSLKLEFYLPLICLIYFAEVLSVIIQVLYFKKTHGKRFFRMAPIHHHFELGGWSETKVVGVFTIVTMVVCAISLLFI